MTIQEFADKVQQETLERMQQFTARMGVDGSIENVMRLHGVAAIITKVIPGNKYTKVDVGSSGKFMIDAEGNIFGIKAYGVIHRGHHYGTLETVDQYYWGDYHPIKKGV